MPYKSAKQRAYMHIDREEIIWAAGLFEGEGSFYVWRKRNQPRASLTTTDRDVIDRFHRAVKVGTVCTPAAIEGRKQRYMWQVSCFQGVQAVMAMFWPWLGSRRRESAKRALSVG